MGGTAILRKGGAAGDIHGHDLDPLAPHAIEAEDFVLIKFGYGACNATAPGE